VPFEYCDENGKCCWCHKGEPTRRAWDWMICDDCFEELEREALESLEQRYRKKRCSG
jgi:hypothetical protein